MLLSFSQERAEIWMGLTCVLCTQGSKSSGHSVFVTQILPCLSISVSLWIRPLQKSGLRTAEMACVLSSSLLQQWWLLLLSQWPHIQDALSDQLSMEEAFQDWQKFQQVKVPSARSHDLSSISTTRAVEAENHSYM